MAITFDKLKNVQKIKGEGHQILYNYGNLNTCA